jgi:hypothetical protein
MRVPGGTTNVQRALFRSSIDDVTKAQRPSLRISINHLLWFNQYCFASLTNELIVKNTSLRMESCLEKSRIMYRSIKVLWGTFVGLVMSDGSHYVSPRKQPNGCLLSTGYDVFCSEFRHKNNQQWKTAEPAKKIGAQRVSDKRGM